MYIVTDCTMQIKGNGYEPVEKHNFKTVEEIKNFISNIINKAEGEKAKRLAKYLEVGDTQIANGYIIDCV